MIGILIQIIFIMLAAKRQILQYCYFIEKVVLTINHPTWSQWRHSHPIYRMFGLFSTDIGSFWFKDKRSNLPQPNDNKSKK